MNLLYNKFKKLY